MLSSLRSTSGSRSRTLRNAFVVGALALAIGALLGASPGCATDGYTPQCENNVTKDGILIHKTKTPCEQFGKCYVDGKEQNSSAKCCVDDKGDPLTGSALTQCQYGFGEIDLDSTGGAGGTTSTGGAGGKT